MKSKEEIELIAALKARNRELEDQSRDLAERNEELLAQKEELTAAIEAFISKSDSLALTVYQLQQRNFELDQILYRASHDLRSPVSSIEGLLQMMHRNDLTEDEALPMKHMHDRIRQMKSLLDALGVLSQASFNPIKKDYVNVERALNNAIDSLLGNPDYKQVKFVRDLEKALVVLTDPFLFSIILRNVIGNALMYRSLTHENIIWIDASVQKRKLVMKISDNGEGILPEVKDRIFEMFFRGSERSIGPGLGLYIVKSIMSRLEGNIVLDHTPGRTTTFTLDFPAD